MDTKSDFLVVKLLEMEADHIRVTCKFVGYVAKSLHK
jgi:hypothetical protein